MSNIWDESWVAEFQKTACHLAGQYIFMECRNPLNGVAIAECTKSVFGNLTVAITPNLPIAQAYDLLLHETAHAKLHGSILIPSTEVELKIIDFHDNPGAIVDEDEAETLANTWWMWAEKIAIDKEAKSGWETLDMSPAQKVAGRLASLLFYE